MATDAQRFTAGWFDNGVYESCLAISLVLPDDVPVQGVFPLRVVEQFFDNRGTGAPKLDDSWMECPYTLKMKWMHRPWPVQPALEDYSIARDVLDRTTLGEIGNDDISPPRASLGQRRSVVVIVLPVKAREPALSPKDGVVGALTLVHWVLTDWLRAARMSTGAPIRELTYGRLPLIIPVRHAGVLDDGALSWSDDRYDIVDDEAMARVLPRPVMSGPHADSIGEAFGQITWGRLGAVQLDHVKRGDSAAFHGDYVGAVLAYATACEIAIVTLSLALAWEDGMQPGDAARNYRDASVTKMLTSLCHPLGGRWSVDDPGFAQDWRIHVSEIRNKIMHAGFRPEHTEVKQARQALETLMTTIPERLVGKWKAYPRTLSLLVSRQSVDLYSSKKARPKILTDLESRSHASEEEFAAWRRAYYSSAVGGGTPGSRGRSPAVGRIRSNLRSWRLRKRTL